MKRPLSLALILCAVTLPAQDTIRTRVVVPSPDSLTLRVGDTARVVGTVRAGSGAAVPGAAVSYTGTNSAAFTAHRDGKVTAKAEGCGAVLLTHSPTARAQVAVCVVAATPVPTPVSSGPAPVLIEDFSSYVDLAQFLTNPRGIYSTLSAASEGNEVFGRDHFSLVPGLEGSPHALRFTFPDRTASASRCRDYSIGVNLRLPAPVQEVWVEVVAQYSANFTTRAPTAWGCTSNPDHKFLFGRVTPSGRFGLHAGTGGGQWTFGYPGNEDNEFGWSASPFDGQWHTYRLHMKAGPVGAATFWLDGVRIRSFSDVPTTASSIYGLAIGRNLNQGPATPQSLTIGRVRVYTADPGWW
ncbi:MAG: LamG domain-containing protein [Gemmatimonadaceae bacterium]